MPSLRDIRRQIKSVKSTEQITRAMKMVAAARMRRSQAAIRAARPFAVKMESMIRDLAAESAQEPGNRFFQARPAGPAGLVLVTSDKGLCGAFNAGVLRAALEWLQEDYKGRPVCLALVGRKGRDFMRRIAGANVEIVTEMAGIFPRVGFQHAEILGRALIDAYFQKGLSRWDVVYNEFQSASQQRLAGMTLMPVQDVFGGVRSDGAVFFSYEPDKSRLLESLLPRHVKAQLYRILLESQAAELAARMNAMDAASNNARELRETLNVQANRQRQGMITKEIAELVGGAEALAA